MYAALFMLAPLSIASPKPEFKLTPEEQAAIKALEPFGFKTDAVRLDQNYPYGTILVYNPLMGFEEITGSPIHAPMPEEKDLAPLAKLTRLRRVDFDAAPIVNDTMLDLFRDMSQLRILDLRRTKITDEGLKKLAGLKRLGSLYLDETEITDVGLKALAEYPALTLISLRKTRVTDRGLESLKKNEHLKFLYLGENKRIGDGCIASLGTMPNLTTVYLGDTGVTDAGLARIAKPDSFPKLFWLVLADTAITGDGLKNLHDPKVLPSLKRITLAGTKATEEHIKALKKARPELEVFVKGFSR